MIRVRAADGTVLVSLGPSYGEWIKSDKIPQVMKDAIIAIEDRRFEIALGRRSRRRRPRAFARQAAARRRAGACRAARPSPSRWRAPSSCRTSTTSGRKVREGVIALAMERKFSKDEILELYLNKVYFGGGAYGIDAASRKFFGHPATKLSARRGGGDRRPGQGAVALFADRRCRGRDRPRRPWCST